MQTDELKRLLARVDLSIDPGSIAQLGNSSWSARTAGGPVVLRFVPASDVPAVRAIRTLAREPGDRFRLLQRLRKSVAVDGGFIAVMEWTPGVTLREDHRDDLPAFFGQLARWHRANAGVLPLYSRYADREYPSVDDFLLAELAFHLRLAGDLLPRDECWELLKPLAGGFPTYVHGDVHPANVLRRADQEYTLLDPEYLHIGINYLDLDYVDWWGLEPDPVPWWVIRREARESVAAYFAALGVDERTAPATMAAVGLLAALQTHTNAVRFGTGDRPELLARLKSLGSAL